MERINGIYMYIYTYIYLREREENVELVVGLAVKCKRGLSSRERAEVDTSMNPEGGKKENAFDIQQKKILTGKKERARV